VARRYIPDRNDIVWLDYEPTKGKEIGKYKPALVLSSKEYNKHTGLLICCPVSTSIRGAVHGSADQELAGTMHGSRKSYPYAGLANEKGEEGNGSGAWGDG